ncbi:unnamed protein product, partial [Closterium sp. NIES-53]
MPLLGGKLHPLAQPPADLEDNEQLYIVRFTREAFRNYEDYLSAIRRYKQRIWTCTETGHSGLTYEEALNSETEAVEEKRRLKQSGYRDLPDWFHKIAIPIVHKSKLSKGALVTAIQDAQVERG